MSTSTNSHRSSYHQSQLESISPDSHSSSTKKKKHKRHRRRSSSKESDYEHSKSSRQKSSSHRSSSSSTKQHSRHDSSDRYYHNRHTYESSSVNDNNYESKKKKRKQYENDNHRSSKKHRRLEPSDIYSSRRHSKHRRRTSSSSSSSPSRHSNDKNQHFENNQTKGTTLGAELDKLRPKSTKNEFKSTSDTNEYDKHSSSQSRSISTSNIPSAGQTHLTRSLPMPPDYHHNSSSPTSPKNSSPISSTKRPRIIQSRDDIHQNQWDNRNVDMYEILTKIGEGTYGEVFKAREKQTSDLCALKKVRLENEKEGFPITAVREIQILRQLTHANIVNLKEIVMDAREISEISNHTSFYLVFEYCDHDLFGLLDSGLIQLNLEHIASFMYQLMSALAYCHTRKFLHRDIKCSNILLNNNGKIKLADFGLARFYNAEDKDRPYTNKVITLWYRPPELLLGEERYGPSVDIWSCGCILGELFQRRPLFQGQREDEQLEIISRLCGSPTPAVWPDVIHLPLFGTLKQKKIYKRRLRDDFTYLTEPAIELFDRMLELDPSRRISANDALQSNWLKDIHEDSIKPIELPFSQDCHEMWSKEHKRLSRRGWSENQIQAHFKEREVIEYQRYNQSYDMQMESPDSGNMNTESPKQQQQQESLSSYPQSLELTSSTSSSSNANLLNKNI